MNEKNNQNQNWETVIGLEIHAELKTKSKMFCSCANSTTRNNAELDNIAEQRGKDRCPKEPNMDICPVCLGMPGALPVMNRQAVKWTILAGLALNCIIGHPISPCQSASKSVKSALGTKWDRKNYFYPDLPKGYQISQYDLPLCYGGYLDLATSNKRLVTSKNTTRNSQLATRIRITRIHLEEDTGTSKHPEGRAEVDYSLLDFNRAGVPLMELVTEPDIRSAQEAKEFCKQYQLILRTLKIADADMEKGQLRCEVNISIRKSRTDANYTQTNADKSAPLGTKVEVKNLNSFKSVERAIEYEIERQTEALESGEKIIQETRGWDEKKSKTYVMRTKETSADYRYFPEPDLPPIILSDRGLTQTQTRTDPSSRAKLTTGQSADKKSYAAVIDIEEIRKQLPEMPKEKVDRYIRDYKLMPSDAQIIASDTEKAKYLVSCIKYHVSSIKQCVNYIINEVPNLDVSPKNLVELINLIDQGKISGKIAKEILPEVKKGKSPSVIVKKKGLEQVSDTSKIETVIDKIIKANPDAIKKIQSGQTGVMGFLVGQVMRETKGQANPKVVNEILSTKLK